MDLVRDLLDAELHDERDRPIGRVDGITLAVRPGAAPRVLTMDVGALTLAGRLPPRPGGWIQALVRAIARAVHVPVQPVHIPMHAIRDIGVDVRVAVDSDAWPELRRGERWLRDHVVRRIPGGGR